jgi:DNA-binding IclR family transcriptional regulator
MTPEDIEMAEAKAALRSLGWYVRYTEWPSGHQVVIHRRSDTSTHRVTSWRGAEVEAWREALGLALGEHSGDDAAIPPA